MKTKLIIVCLILLLVACIIVFAVLQKQKESISISNIKSFSFSYSAGYMMYSNANYDIVKKDNKFIATVRPLHKTSDEIKTIEIDDAFIINLENFLNQYEVSKWNGFNKTNQNVLDGDSFYISVNMENGNSVHASGYMMYPKNYKEVERGIVSIFDELYKK